MKAEIKISAFIAGEASGSSVSDTSATRSGYCQELRDEMAQVVPVGGTVTLSVDALAELAEWADCMEPAVAVDNPSGARAMAGLCARAMAAAQGLVAAEAS